MATATPDVIERKVEKIFNALDADQNGYVDWSDFQRIVDRYLTEYQLDRNDRRAMALHASYAMFWQELMRHGDVGGDQRLTRDEYIETTRATTLDNSRFDAVDGFTHVLFDVIDTDGDDEINRDEFHRFACNIWAASTAEAARAFETLDTDGDGLVSRAEFVRASREFFLSSAPDSPGSVLLGTV